MQDAIQVEPIRNLADMPAGLDAFQRELILSAFPRGSAIREWSSYRPWYLVYPVRVCVELPGGIRDYCVVKTDRVAGGLGLEARLLPVLSRLGLPVQTILAGPTAHPEYPEGGPLLVVRELPGKSLPFINSTLEEIDLVTRLLEVGLRRLHGVTSALRRISFTPALPERTLPMELEGIKTIGGPWFDDPLFARAVKILDPACRAVQTPLAFTNGDYNPLNFLHIDGTLSGYVDFCGARFEDPYLGLAKFLIWSFDLGWCSGGRGGLVERLLYSFNVSRREFAPRLALRCLGLLQSDVPMNGGDEHENRYRRRTQYLLSEAVSVLGG